MSLIQHFEKLSHFKIVASEGSFAAAAKVCGQSQPAVFYSVRKLEENLGVQLLLRNRLGVRLTPAGKRLLDLTNKLFAECQSFELALKGGHAPVEEIVVATHAPYTAPILVPAFNQIKSVFNAESLSLRSNLSAKTLISWVEMGTVDFSVVAESKVPKTLHFLTLFEDWYEFYCTKKFAQKFLNRGRLGTHQTNVPLIYIGPSIAGTFRTLDRALWKVGLDQPSAVQVDSYEAVAATASLGLGVACLPRRIAIPEYFGLVRVPVEKPLERLAKFLVLAVYKNETYKPKIQQLVALLGKK